MEERRTGDGERKAKVEMKRGGSREERQEVEKETRR